MPSVTVAVLAAMTPSEYGSAVKERLCDDEGWVILLHPALVARTQYTLRRMIASIDEQKVRLAEENDFAWEKKVNFLRKHMQRRLDSLVTPEEAIMGMSSSKEAKAWRSFAARIARAMLADDDTVLDRVQAPFTGLTIREWIAARDEKVGQ